MFDKKELLKKYKQVGNWVKFYSKNPKNLFYEILIQNYNGEYIFKNEFNTFTSIEDQTDFWFSSIEDALEFVTARQLTADNLEANIIMPENDYDKELERRLNINKKILANTFSKNIDGQDL